MKKKMYQLLVKTPVFTIVTILAFFLLTIFICLKFNIFNF